MAVPQDESKSSACAPKKLGRPARAPSARNCATYERVRLEGESHQRVGADYVLSRQTVAEIIARVESWLAAHPTHLLGQKMRVRCGKRWETLWLARSKFSIAAAKTAEPEKRLRYDAPRATGK